jgi:hypothetical protein
MPGQFVVSITESTKENLLVPAMSTGLQAMIAVFDQVVTVLWRPDNAYRAGYRCGRVARPGR